MEANFALTYNGQALQQQDLALIGQTSGLADDRVLAELLRMMPFNGAATARGILPSGYDTGGIHPSAVVDPNGASGSVRVWPFRAFIGSRTAVGTDARLNWQDIRSGLSVASGSTSLTQTVALAANSSGNPRWDLVYAVVNIAAPGPSTVRKVKDTTSFVVSSLSVSTYTMCSVTLAVVQGTPSVAPAFPFAPVDSGTTYYIPLAQVRVPNGFGAGSTVATTDIAVQAPMLKLASQMGAKVMEPANQQYAVSVAQQNSWGSTGARPGIWMPPGMTGGNTLLIAMDLKDPSSANWSHQTNGIVDSRDWRGRLVRGMGYAAGVASSGLAWNGTLSGEPSAVMLGAVVHDSADTADQLKWSFGQSINETSLGSGKATIFEFVGDRMLNQADGTVVDLYVDMASGALKVAITGTPTAMFYLWLDFTGVYPNK